VRKPSIKDERWTPPDLFEKWDSIFHFTIDVAADKNNKKCERFYDKEVNGLAQSWSGEVVWCNPPYSNLDSWVQKAHEETEATICMLIPANRTEQKFWQKYIEPYRDNGGRLTTHFIEKRIQFIHPEKGKMGAPMFGCVMLVWKEQ
jgi:phage N-6-adenine-methyltransferase